MCTCVYVQAQAHVHECVDVCRCVYRTEAQLWSVMSLHVQLRVLLFKRRLWGIKFNRFVHVDSVQRLIFIYFFVN